MRILTIKHLLRGIEDHLHVCIGAVLEQSDVSSEEYPCAVVQASLANDNLAVVRCLSVHPVVCGHRYAPENKE